MTATPSPASAAQRYAYTQLGRYGWDASQFGCLVPLWDRESSWSNTARERHTGAYGIPQANHHGDHGAPYPAAYEAANPRAYGGRSDVSTQIDWGLKYIADVYRTPCGAWDTERAQGSY